MMINKNEHSRKPKFDVSKLKKEAVSVKVEKGKIVIDKNNPNEVEWYHG